MANTRIKTPTAGMGAILAVVFSLSACGETSNWSFREPPSTIVVTQRLVIQKKYPILFVIHDTGGDWMFLADDRTQLDPVIELSFRDLVAIDSTVSQVADLGPGWKAQRATRQSPWIRSVYK
jgi:hypothetical protein